MQINDDILRGTKSISIIDVVRLEPGSETDIDGSRYVLKQIGQMSP